MYVAFPSSIPQPTSLSRADSGTISYAAMTASEQELSEKSPVDRGGEDGSGSESSSDPRGSDGNLHIVAEAKLGSRERGRVEQERQSLEEIPAAAVEGEGRQDSDPVVPHSVGDNGRFEDATESEEDPLAVGGGPSSPEGKSAIPTQENESQNQDAAEIGSGNQDKGGPPSEPDVEHPAGAVSENGKGSVDPSGNGPQTADTGGGLEEVTVNVCTEPEQSLRQEQPEPEEASPTVSQPIEKHDSCTEPPTQHPHADDGEEEGASTEESSHLPVIVEASEAVVEKLEEASADVEVEKEKEKDEDREEGGSVSEESEQETSPPECPLPLTSQPTEMLQSSSPPKEPQHKTSPPKEPQHKSSPPKEPQHNISPPKEAQQSSSPPKEPQHKTSPPKEPQHKTSPPKEPQHKSSPLKEPQHNISPPKETQQSSSPPKEAQQSSSLPKETQHNSSPPQELLEGTSLLEDIPAASSLEKGAPTDASLPKDAEASGSSPQASPLSESEGSNTAPTEVKDAVGNQEEGPPPPEVGERVFVETASGLKMGVVKYVGETQFQSGLWIGVALERPSGGQCDVMHVQHVMSHDMHVMPHYMNVMSYDMCM